MKPRVKVTKNKKLTASTSKPPVAVGTSLKRSVPLFSNRDDRTIRVTHTEYFVETPMSLGLSISKFVVNPGLSGLFPWLSPIALRYEFYEFRKLCFRFVARTPTITAGTMAAIFDFDVLDPSPNSLLEAMSTQDHVADAIWKDSQLNVRLGPSGRKYCRSGFPTLGQYDERQYDLGNLFILVEGAPDGGVAGMWAVDYIVDLINPQVQDEVGVSNFVNNDQPGQPHRDRVFPGPEALKSGQASGTLHGRIPWDVLADGSGVKFKENFEGLLQVVLHGVGIGTASPKTSIGGDPRGQLSPPLNVTRTGENADLLFSLAIKAFQGNQINVGTLENYAIQWAQTRLARAAFDQLYSAVSEEEAERAKASMPPDPPSRRSFSCTGRS